MSHDAEIIAQAITAIKPTPDYLKDYIFPFVIAFFSALLGGISAIYINRHQELKNIAKENYISANQVFLLAQECLSNLVAIKYNYEDIKSDHPLVRAGHFPTIITNLDDVTFNAHSLYFIRTIPTANKKAWQKLVGFIKYRILRKKIEQPSAEELRKSWRNIVKISSMFGNYNQVMGLLRMRNSMNEEVKQLLSEGNNIMLYAPIEEVRKRIGDKLCGGFVDVTESVISLTDYVMQELHNFLLEFSEIAESNIELKRIKEWGRFPIYKNTQEAFLECMKTIIKPNYKILSEYTGAPEEKLRNKYNFNELA